MAYIDVVVRDLELSASRDLVRASDPTQQSILLRLLTERGTCFWDRDFGSTLGALGREKIGADVTRVVEDRARHALKPLVDEGSITELETAAQRVDRNRVELVLRCKTANKRPIFFNLFIRVG